MVLLPSTSIQKKPQKVSIQDDKIDRLIMTARKKQNFRKRQNKSPNVSKKPLKEDLPVGLSDESSTSSREAMEQTAAAARTSTPAKNQPPKNVKKAPSNSESSSSDTDDDEDKGVAIAKKASKDDTSSSDDESESVDDDWAKQDAPLFSDKNASWLKPKKQAGNLLGSDDDEESEENKDYVSEDEEGGEVLAIEHEARLADQEHEDEKEEAEEELQRTIREHTSTYHLPTKNEIGMDVDRVVPPSEIRSHIDSILEVLAEFKKRREPGRSRKEYIDQLGSFISELYGYIPELVEYFLTMFGPAETLEFVDQSDKARPLVIRTNTLKARRKDLAAALMKRGVSLDPLASWSKVGLKIVESPVPIGATPEYLSGMYMLQSASSMCTVLALSPEPKERILDVSAAPGGKTSYIAQLMRNTGVIIANDLKAERQKATVANMHRLGVKNVIACKHDGRKVGALFKNRFDRVLLDAPCSGLGVISRDPSVKVQRTLADITKCAHLQKELILAAIDTLKFKGTTGGVMVYSTCSISVAENEEVVNYALSKRDIRLVETGLDFGRHGFTRFQDKRFHPSVALTRRFYPHVHNMDGFFVAKIQKLSDGRPGVDKAASREEEEQLVEYTANGEKELVVIDNETEKPKAQEGPKKRKRKEEGKTNKVKEKNPLVSIPPTKPKQKKRKQDAKVTKPRRKQVATDA